MTSSDRSALLDGELVELLASDPELLALADAMVETQPRRGLRPARRRSRFVSVAAAAALLLGGAVAAPALGFHLSSIVSFSDSDRAPVPVQETFSALDLGAPPSLPLQAIASQTRVVSQPGAPALYISPTQPGGYCFQWQGAGGTCDELGTAPLVVVWGEGRIVGSVAAAYSAAVRVRFSDGTSAQPDITWVSKPINAGFFVYTPPPGEIPVEADAYASDGSLVAQQLRGPTRNDGTATSPPRFAVTAQERVALAFPSSDGVATAYVAPSTIGGKCAWLELGDHVVLLYAPGNGGCLPPGQTMPDGIAFHLVRIGQTLILTGAAAPYLARFELSFPDGTAVTITPTADGLLVYRIPDSEAGSPASITVTALGRDGTVLFRDLLSQPSELSSGPGGLREVP